MDKDIIQVLKLQQFGATDIEFYVNSLSNHLQTSSLHIDKPHRHNFFAAFLFLNGSGSHEIDFTSYEVKPGSVFLLSPGQTHSWSLSQDCEGILFFHSQDFYETHYIREALRDYQFFSFVHNRVALFLDENALLELSPLFIKLLKVKTTKYCLKKRQLLLSIITHIYIELEQHISKENFAVISGRNGYYQKFLHFQKLVEEHFRTVKTMHFYAEMMHMTPKHLNRINKMIVNKTTNEIITDRLMLEAKRMLIYKKDNFSEVSYQLGFNDYAHFSKLFKNKTGETPSTFSKKYA